MSTYVPPSPGLVVAFTKGPLYGIAGRVTYISPQLRDGGWVVTVTFPQRVAYGGAAIICADGVFPNEVAPVPQQKEAAA